MTENELVNIAALAIDKIKEKKLTLAVAESCTGGWLSKILTDISGVSAVYKGGICSYSNDIKEKILGVNPDTLHEFGAVSEQVARQMATGVRNAMGTDIGIGITGIAGPLSDNTNKPVGLIYIALSYDDTVIVKKLLNTFNDNIRTNNRLSAIENALNLLGDIDE